MRFVPTCADCGQLKARTGKAKGLWVCRPCKSIKASVIYHLDTRLAYLFSHEA